MKLTLLVVLLYFPLYCCAQFPQLASNLSAGSKSSVFGDMFAYNHKLLFSVDTSASPTIDLCITDGTPSGTRFLKKFDNGGSWAYGFTVCNNKAFFIEGDTIHGNELWVTDGTSAGTNMVKDIYSGPNDGVNSFLVSTGGMVYFVGSDSTHTRQLWKSDGTASGTKLVVNLKSLPFGGIISGNDPTGIAKLVVANNRLFFPVMDTNTLEEDLWVSDGTAGGTHLTAGITLGSQSIVQNLMVDGGKVFYNKGVPSNYPVTTVTTIFCVSDGTKFGTIKLKDNLLASSDYTLLGNKIFFYSTKIVNFSGQLAPYFSLSVSDGTVSGTSIIGDGVGSVCQYNTPLFLISFDNKLFFHNDYELNDSDTAFTPGLWISDGTTSGTRLLDGINWPASLTVNGNYFYFLAYDLNTEIWGMWYSNGHAGGTHPMSYPGVNYFFPNSAYNGCVPFGPLTLVDDKIYYPIIYDTSIGFELYSVPQATRVNDVIAISSDMNIYPNPASNSFQMKSQFDVAQSCDIDLLDITGRLVQHLMVNEKVQAGNIQFTFPVKDIANGIYLVRIQDAEKVQIQRLLISH